MNLHRIAIVGDHIVFSEAELHANNAQVNSVLAIITNHLSLVQINILSTQKGGKIASITEQYVVSQVVPPAAAVIGLALWRLPLYSRWLTRSLTSPRYRNPLSSVIAPGRLRAFFLLVACVWAAVAAPAVFAQERPLLTAAQNGCPIDTKAEARAIKQLEKRDPIARAHVAALLARCGDSAIPALIEQLDASLLSEEAEGAPEDQQERSDRIIWVLTNSAGAPEDALLEWIRRGPASADASTKDAVAQSRLSATIAILGARGALGAEQIAGLLTAPERDLRAIGIALLPTIPTDIRSVAAPLAILADSEADAALRQEARLAIMALGDYSQASHWIDTEENESRLWHLRLVAKDFLPLDYLIDRARPPFPVANRTEAIRLLADRTSLPPDAIGPLLDAADEARTTDPDGWWISRALRRIDPDESAWLAELDRLLAMAGSNEAATRSIGLRQLAALGHRAASAHLALRALHNAALGASKPVENALAVALLATAPSDDEQQAISLDMIEQSAAQALDKTSNLDISFLTLPVLIALVADVAPRAASMFDQPVWQSALADLLATLDDSSEGTTALARLLADFANTHAHGAICKALYNIADPTTDLASLERPAASLWWQHCRPTATSPTLPSLDQLQTGVRAARRQGESYDPLDIVLADSNHDLAPDRSWAEALLKTRDLPQSYGLAIRWCLAAAREPMPDALATNLLARVEWTRAISLLECPLSDSPGSRQVLWSRIVGNPASFRRFAQRNPDMGCELLEFASDAASTSPALARAEVRALVGLLFAKAAFVRACASRVAGSFAPDPVLTRALQRLADENNALVAQPASEALLRLLVDNDKRWPRAAARATELGIADALAQFARDDSIPTFPLARGNDDEDSTIVVTGSRVTAPTLPPFPWPPPRYAARMTFGVEAPRSLLGSETASLGSVHDRLIAALRTVDRQYSSGLFGVAGGFVLVTRMEQIDEQGRPVSGAFRWRSYRSPPATLTDYLVRLFLAPPGHYRTLSFVFTDQTNLAPGSKALPDIDNGNTILPDAVAARRFSGVNAYVFIYAFAKKDTDQIVRVWRDLSAGDHLNHTGILHALNN